MDIMSELNPLKRLKAVWDRDPKFCERVYDVYWTQRTSGRVPAEWTVSRLHEKVDKFELWMRDQQRIQYEQKMIGNDYEIVMYSDLYGTKN